MYADYDALFHAKANNCCESIFELQFRNDPEQAWNQWGMFYIMIGWRTDKLTLSGNAQATIASGTYGFMNPRKSLYDAFVSEEGVDGYRLKCSVRTYEQMQAEGVNVAAGSRLVGNEGYFSWKTRILKEDCVIDQSYFQVLQYINHRVMRYGEVLLMAAEAHLQSGGGRALEYINKVRERAQLDPLASVTMDDIKTERRLELCLEGCRFHGQNGASSAGGSLRDHSGASVQRTLDRHSGSQGETFRGLLQRMLPVSALSAAELFRKSGQRLHACPRAGALAPLLFLGSRQRLSLCGISHLRGGGGLHHQ